MMNTSTRARQRDLRQAEILQPRNHADDDACADVTDGDAADECLNERNDGARRAGAAAAHQQVEQHGEQHDGRGVVEQALAFDQTGQPRRRADIAKDRNHGHRIGRRHHRSQEQTDNERDAGDEVERQADDEGGDDDRDDREHEDRPASSNRRRASIVSDDWKSSAGRNTYMNVPDVTGRSRNARATSPDAPPKFP